MLLALPAWSPASAAQDGWQHRVCASDESRRTINFARHAPAPVLLPLGVLSVSLLRSPRSLAAFSRMCPRSHCGAALGCLVSPRVRWRCACLSWCAADCFSRPAMLQSTPTPGPRGRGAVFGTSFARGQHLDETMQRGWCAVLLARDSNSAWLLLPLSGSPPGTRHRRKRQTAVARRWPCCACWVRVTGS